MLQRVIGKARRSHLNVHWDLHQLVFKERCPGVISGSVFTRVATGICLHQFQNVLQQTLDSCVQRVIAGKPLGVACRSCRALERKRVRKTVVSRWSNEQQFVPQRRLICWVVQLILVHSTCSEPAPGLAPVADWSVSAPCDCICGYKLRIWGVSELACGNMAVPSKGGVCVKTEMNLIWAPI